MRSGGRSGSAHRPLLARTRPACSTWSRRMTPITRLRNLGQSLWLDNITRGMLDDGTLARYADDWSITGLTSNPTIFQHAIKGSTAYDDDIAARTRAGRPPQALFFDLAIADLRRAADLFRPVWEHTHGVDGWVSLGENDAKSFIVSNGLNR